MKTFQQFCEDAAQEYQSGMQSYEKSGVVQRLKERQRATEEARKRRTKSKRFAKKQQQISGSAQQDIHHRFETQQQQAAHLKAKQQRNKTIRKQKAAKLAQNLKTSAKGALQLTKKLIKSVRNRRRRSDSQEN